MLSFLKPREKDSGWLDRLKQGLARTRSALGAKLAGVFGAGRKLDPELYEELETALLTSDVGVTATEELIRHLRERARREGFTEASQLKAALKEALL